MDKVYWTTKNGNKIDIDKMDVDHLRNCLKMIVRKSKINKAFEEYKKTKIRDLQNDEPYCDDWMWK